MAQYSFGNRSRGQRNSNNDFIGNVVLKVESFDFQRNAATGITTDGEEMTIRLADAKEFADMFANRQRYTTEDARLRVGKQQTGNRPGMDTMAQKMEIGVGAIQFQSVKRIGNDELVARWMESVATTMDDTYVRAQVRIPVPKSNEETAGANDRRRADIVLPNTATAATMEVLDQFTQNRITGDDGRTLDGDIRSAVFVAVQSVDDPVETPSSLVWVGWDKENKRLETGGEALFDRPLNAHNWETMVPLAAQAGVPFSDLKFADSVNAQDRGTNAPGLYDATMAGNIKVVVAQGFTAEIMPRLVGDLVKSEQAALDSEGRRATMSDRGFFEADIGLRYRDGSGDYSAQTSVKQVLANEFLPAAAANNYVRRELEAIGERAISAAESRGVVLTKPQEIAPAPAPEPSPRQANDARLAATFAASSNDM